MCPALSLIPHLKQDNQMQNAAVFESKLSAVTVFFSLLSKTHSCHLLVIIKIKNEVSAEKNKSSELVINVIMLIPDLL